MAVVQRSDSKYYWLTLERPGQRPIRRATRILVKGRSRKQTLENRRLAEHEYHAAMTDLAKGRLGMKTTEAPTFSAFLPRYEKSLKGRAHAEETIRRLKKLFLPTFGPRSLDAIRPSDIATWRETRRKVSDQTIVRDLTALRGLLAKAVEWDVIDADPLAALHFHAKPGREIVRYLLAHEERALLTELAARDAHGMALRDNYNRHRAERHKPPYPALPYYADSLTPMVMLALHTGIRRGELMQLHWSAVNDHAQTLTVTAQTAKSKKTRHIPLNADARLALDRWREQSGHKTGLIFRGERTKAKMTSIQSWEAVLEAATITDFRWHDLRHTFASKLVQRGVALQVVRDLLGHSTMRMTERYAHLAPAQGRAAVDLLAG